MFFLPPSKTYLINLFHIIVINLKLELFMKKIMSDKKDMSSLYFSSIIKYSTRVALIFYLKKKTISSNNKLLKNFGSKRPQCLLSLFNFFHIATVIPLYYEKKWGFTSNSKKESQSARYTWLTILKSQLNISARLILQENGSEKGYW